MREDAGFCFVVAALPVLVIMSMAVSGRPEATQQEDQIPRVVIATRGDLVVALQGRPDLFESRLRLGLLAAQGPRLLPLLRAIVQDESESDRTRANAIGVLGLMLDSSSVPFFIDLISRDPWPLQAAAYNALVTSPYPEACALWRSILRNWENRGVGPSMALSGIRFCDTETDIPLVQMLVPRLTPGLRLIAERSIEELRKPLPERYRLTQLEGNYPPTGTYRPPPRIADEIRAQLCGGPCPHGAVVQPSALARLHNR
jgi:hypothetical protein